MSSLTVGCILVIVCTVVVSIISVVIPYWITEEKLVRGVEVYYYAGLWKTCATADDVTECLAFNDVKDWVHVVRALIITGTLLLIGSFLLAYLFNRNQTNHTEANKCIATLCVAGIFLIAAVIHFARKVEKDDEATYSSAFYMAITTAIVAMLTAVAVHIAKAPPGYTEIGTVE